ncbi:hypothetical protein [Streptomyces sp. NPDC049555]|uniref:hypothetical protein n=1 Tax=Streptomyces sp. NPDC049555 TaxID=3154930 RepID=UPI003443B9E7
MRDDELIAIERELAQGQWVPSADEKGLAEEVFARKQRLEAEARQHPAGMPAPQEPQGLLLTQVVTVQARLSRELDDEALPPWRTRLRDSPMLSLVEAFTAACRELAPVSDRLLVAWRTAPPPPPEQAIVVREAQRLGLSLEAAEEHTRYWQARHWEDDQLPVEKRREVEGLLHWAGTIATVIYAAGTGHVEY